MEPNHLDFLLRKSYNLIMNQNLWNDIFIQIYVKPYVYEKFSICVKSFSWKKKRKRIVNRYCNFDFKSTNIECDVKMVDFMRKTFWMAHFTVERWTYHISFVGQSVKV